MDEAGDNTKQGPQEIFSPISRCLSCWNIFFHEKKRYTRLTIYWEKKNSTGNIFLALVFLVTFHLNGFLGNGIKYFSVRVGGGSCISVNGKYLWRLSVFVRLKLSGIDEDDGTAQLAPLDGLVRQIPRLYSHHHYADHIHAQGKT